MKKFPRWLLPVAVLVLVFLVTSVVLYVRGKRDADYILNNGGAVQVAGRMRLEWQRTARFLYEIKSSTAQNYSKLRADLETSVGLFDRCVTALKDGGSVDFGRAGVFQVAPNALTGDATEAIDQIAASWSEMSGLMKQLGSNAELDSVALDSALTILAQKDAPMSGLQSMLLGVISVSSFAATERVGNLQKVATILGCLFIATLIGLYSRQLMRTQASRKEIDEILQTVPSGLFLLDRNYRVGSQYSQHLERVLGQGAVGGKSIFDLLGKMTSPETLDVARDYLSLLFGDQVDENLIDDVNPLNRLDAVIANESGRAERRNLGFGFKRVMEGKKLLHVLVTVTDITEREQLREQVQKLEKNADQADGQTLDMITSALSMDPQTLTERMARYQQLLDEANSKLKASGRGNAAYRQLVDELFRPLHTLKGETAALGFRSVANGAEAAEAELVQLRQKSDLTGNDFLGVTMRLDELYARLNKLAQLQRKLSDAVAQRPSGLTNDLSPPAAVRTPELTTRTPSASATLAQSPHQTGQRPVVSVVAQARASMASATVARPMATTAPAAPARAAFDINLIQQACLRTAQKLGKEVSMQTQGFTEAPVPEAIRQPLTDVLVQLVRNALAHGVDLPDARVKKGKPAAGLLSVQWQKVPGGHELSFKDDGDGLNFEAIRQRAVQLGRFTTEQAQALDSRALAGLIFEPGFSTAQKANDTAGQGVGLDVVMAAVKRANGKIAVGTQAGQYTQFRVRFPEAASA